MSENFNQLGIALQDRYQLKAELGRGGMATVYLAQDLQHGRRVAIKVLHPELAGAVGHDRFLREIRIASDLSHPHILPLLDSGSTASGTSKLPYYVMPFVEGESLRAKLQRERQLPIQEAVKIAHDVATALSYAHAHGVVHRDIKPENILLAGNEAVVADFGIARAIDRASEGEVITSAGLAVGTPAYMSPEQAAGHQEVDGRSDIYSLGCVLYEMLGGHPPFTGPSANAIAARHRVDDVPPLRTIRPSVPPSLEAVILQALEKVPADRFKTAYQFAAALEQQHTPSSQTPSEYLDVRESTPSTARTIATPVPRWRVGRRARRVAAVAIGATLLLLLAWWAMGQTRRLDNRPRYSNHPTWSAWRGWTGEYFPLVAFSDSILVVKELTGEGAQVYDGERWTALAVPDSFELLRYVGTLAGGKLLTAKRFRDPSGEPQLQYGWLELSSSDRPTVEAVGSPLPDDDSRPHWWTDGRDVALWLGSIQRLEGAAWIREPTGTTGGYADLWGIDGHHRFAIPAAGDSLLVFDGISWKSVDILGPGSAGQAVYRAGASFPDGATIVLGDECAGDQRCRPLVMQQDSFGGAWHRVSIPRSVGIPVAMPADTADRCSTSQFSLLGVGGRSSDDYFVWGSWSSCDLVVKERDIAGCPRNQPCFWHVDEGRLRPVEELLGKMVQAVGYMGGSAYALLDDGMVWRRVDEGWRAVSQVPGLPVRMIGASSRMIIRLKGSDVRYEPGWSEGGTPFIVRHMDSIPGSVRAEVRPRRLLVRDTTAVLLTAEGGIFTSQCRMDRMTLRTGTPTGTLSCSAWRQLPAPTNAIRDLEILPTGQLIGVGSPGLVVTWTDGVPRVEKLPSAAARESLWGVDLAMDGRALAISTTRVLERDTAGRWTVLRTIVTEGAPNARFLALPGEDLAVVERALQVWDRSADSIAVSTLYRYAPGGATVEAIHVLPDGRLIAGLANPDDPLIGGRLVVWEAPARANRSQDIELPISVDVTDLTDDGRYLHVVGRGGSLQIPLDSLPFSSPPRP